MDIYMSAFYTCIDCNFDFSLLGEQNQYKVSGTCPCCSGDVTYMSKEERELYITKLKDELKYM